MKVSGAVVCLDCDEVFDREVVDCCPSCGGLSFVYLRRYFPALDSARPGKSSEETRATHEKEDSQVRFPPLEAVPQGARQDH